MNIIIMIDLYLGLMMDQEMILMIIFLKDSRNYFLMEGQFKIPLLLISIRKRKM
jgi:hypothetical protein